MSLANTYQLLIFDWDGTIMNSASRITQCMQQMERALNITVHSDTEIQQYIGLSLETAISRMHPELHETQLTQAVSTYRSVYLGHPNASELFQGAAEMIKTLHQHYQLAIATGKGRQGLNKALTHHNLSSMFTASRTADQTRSKPDPQMLEELLIETATPVEKALMIGDTTYDLDMAKVINMDSVGVSYGVHSIEQLTTAQPLTIVHSIAELQNWLMPQNLKHHPQPHIR